MKRFISIILISILFLTACTNKDENKDVARERHDMIFYDYFDTVIEISIFEHIENFDEVKEKTEDLIKKEHELLTDFDESGVVATINSKGEGENRELAKLVKRTLDMEKKTGYLVDISRGDLFRLWKDGIENEYLPDQMDIEKALKNGGADTIKVDGDKIILSSGAKLDTGSVCKGYLNELLIKLYSSMGFENYIISAGGNVTAAGRPLDGRRNYSVGVENPFDIESLYDIIYTTDKSLVTSGDYQRFAIIDGKRYHHILDVRTGYPAENSKRSITVVGKEPFVCDFLSTTLFLMEDEEIKETMKDFPEYDYYIIYSDGSHFTSEGISDIIKTNGAEAN